MIKVYFRLADGLSSGMMLPKWLFNHALGSSCTWRCLPHKVVIPSMVPAELSDYCCVLKQCGPEQGIVKAGLESGMMLTKEQLVSLWQVEKFPLPDKGSGKSGNKIKKDFALAALRHYFKGLDEASEEFTFMFNALMGTTKTAQCPDEVIAAVQALEPIEQEDWKDVKQAAVNQKHQQEPSGSAARNKRKPKSGEEPGTPGRAQASGSGLGQYEKKRYTPGELVSLIPGRGTLTGVYLKRCPTAGTSSGLYQGFYPVDEGALYASINGSMLV